MAVTSCPAYEPAPKNRSEVRGVPGGGICSLSPVPARPVQAAYVKTITHRRRSRKSFPAFSKNFSILSNFYVNCVMYTCETEETAPPLRRRGFAGYVVVFEKSGPKISIIPFFGSPHTDYSLYNYRLYWGPPPYRRRWPSGRWRTPGACAPFRRPPRWTDLCHR